MVLTSDVLLVLCAILFPPAPVAFLTGCSCDLLIAVLLTLLGALPGHIYALFIIYAYIKAREEHGLQGFVYVGNGRYEVVPGSGSHPGPAEAPPSVRDTFPSFFPGTLCSNIVC